MKVSERRYPKSPMPAQRQPEPGIESNVRPRPLSEGDAYGAAGKLEGRAALITGGDSGIGRAVASFFAKEGADVAITYLAAEQKNAEETERIVARLGRRCVLIPGNVADPAFCEKAVHTAAEELGRLNILVNNAAAFQNSCDRLEDTSAEKLEITFRTNIPG